MRDQVSLLSGGIFVTIGCIYGITAWLSLPIGNLTDMGPGYFPIVLSGLMTLLGAAIVARGVLSASAITVDDVPWRALTMNTIAILSFAFFVRSLGLFPTVMLTAFLSGLGSPGVSLSKAAIAGFAIAVLCTVIFGFVIGLPIAIIGPWLGGFI